jgi:hypothetical protein
VEVGPPRVSISFGRLDFKPTKKTARAFGDRATGGQMSLEEIANYLRLRFSGGVRSCPEDPAVRGGQSNRQGLSHAGSLPSVRQCARQTPRPLVTKQ